MNTTCQVLHLYISPGHNFFGHHGQPSGTHPMVEMPEIRCLAGRGIEGDRFCDYKEDYKGQITFFASETYEALCHRLYVWNKNPGVFRRNVILQGLDLNTLVGTEFHLQGIRFLGVEEAKPCHWMDEAFAPGAEDALVGRGGLRARILNDGLLRPSSNCDVTIHTVAPSAASTSPAAGLAGG